MRQLSITPLTLPTLTPPQFLLCAAQAGFGRVALRILQGSPRNRPENMPLLVSGAGRLAAGVQLVLYGATSMGGNTNINLTAINSDPYDGVLIWQPASNANALSLIGNPGSKLTGIVYAPSADVSLQGHAGATITVDFVVKTLALQGDATITSYASVNPSSLLKSVRLVE